MSKAPRFAFDPRLAIGVLLVAASVTGVLVIVSAADETTVVYATPGSLMPGDRVRPGDLVETNVRLDAGTAEYLIPGEVPAAGVVITRPVGEGELLPASAVGRTEGLRLTALVIPVAAALAASVEAGALVDLWASPEVENGEFGPPAIIVPDARVARLVETESVIAGSTSAVEVLVPRSRVARVLEAIADADAISIVPATLPLRG